MVFMLLHSTGCRRNKYFTQSTDVLGKLFGILKLVKNGSMSGEDKCDIYWWQDRVSSHDADIQFAFTILFFVQVFFCSWSTRILIRCLFLCRRNNSQKIMTESECILTSRWVVQLEWNVDCLCPYSYKWCFLKQQKHLALLLLWYLITFLIKTSLEASCLVMVFLVMLVCMLWVAMSEWGSWVMSNVIWRKRAKNEGKGSVKLIT